MSLAADVVSEERWPRDALLGAVLILVEAEVSITTIHRVLACLEANGWRLLRARTERTEKLDQAPMLTMSTSVPRI